MSTPTAIIWREYIGGRSIQQLADDHGMAYRTIQERIQKVLDRNKANSEAAEEIAEDCRREYTLAWKRVRENVNPPAPANGNPPCYPHIGFEEWLDRAGWSLQVWFTQPDPQAWVFENMRKLVAYYRFAVWPWNAVMSIQSDKAPQK
jgi:hypothetical protein